MKTRIYLCLLLLMAGMTMVDAHDFTTTIDGQKLYFDITSKVNRTAKVTYPGSIATAPTLAEVKGVVSIPAKVKHDNVIYSITAIGPKAFSGATELTGIIMPQGIVSIGDFAFEGCTKLEKVIFPGNKVKFGQGTFFRCFSIKDVTMGSDWNSIDLSMFRWSDSLQCLTIPAKIEKIQNMKKLKALTMVTVDPNNSRFASFDGMLYNRDGSTLYGVPRAFAGKLKIHDGTEVITIGAFIDCPGITSIDLPASVKAMSMRETSRLDQLETILFRAETPMTTGYHKGTAALVLQVANEKVKIVVPSVNQKAYQEALASEGGEYTADTHAESIPYTIITAQLPQSKSVIGTKSFTKYE